jgi:hypothetical protein
MAFTDFENLINLIKNHRDDPHTLLKRSDGDK